MWYADKQIIEFAELKLVGLVERTCYQNEINPAVAKITKVVTRYWMEGVASKIPSRVNPQNTYAVYSNYSSDEYGEYDYFLGQEVDSFDNIPEGLSTLVIPACRRVKFTTQADSLPKVIIDAWQNIWKTPPDELGGKRIYTADFEVYDIRAMNPMSAIVDIYLGIE